MADLTFIEKSKLERLFGMESGYVLDFTDRQFREFVADTTGKDILDQKYAYASGSKANRLRAFWREEPDHVVGRVLTALIDHCKPTSVGQEDPTIQNECRRIAARLLQDAPLHDADFISALSAEKGFEAVTKAVTDAIENNEPESGLDRLHTFTTKYVRFLCAKHGITVDRDKPLHSLFGEYVKHLKKLGLFESDMTERILKSSISILDAFNDVRNNRSLAHDNPVLSHRESLLIFNHVTTSIRFISTLEASGHITKDTQLPTQ
jgi:hypothetical protein